MSLSLKALLTAGTLGGGCVLLPWGWNKLRSGNSNIASSQISSSESGSLEVAQVPDSPHLPEAKSPLLVSEIPPKDSALHPQAPVEKKEEIETGDCIMLEEVPSDVKDFFWTITGEDTTPYITISCKNANKNPLITAETWGGLFPEGLFSTLRDSLKGKKFDIKVEVAPKETGLNNYSVAFNGENKFNNPVTGTWNGEEQNTDTRRALKVISITSPAVNPNKIYIWSN